MKRNSAAETLRNALERVSPEKVLFPEKSSELTKAQYYVYGLAFDGRPLVVGHGRRNRAKIIFDDLNAFTRGHLKALHIRLHLIYGSGKPERFLIPCADKGSALSIEKRLHAEIGGNVAQVTKAIQERLLENVPDKAKLLLKLCLLSQYSGLDDLRNWRAHGIIEDAEWKIICERLRLTG